jgi:putative membrane protein
MEKKQSRSAWSIGWGWWVAIPLFAAASMAAKNIKKSGCCHNHGDEIKPLDHLKDRYVRGEINREEYLEKLIDIQ